MEAYRKTWRLPLPCHYRLRAPPPSHSLLAVAAKKSRVEEGVHQRTLSFTVSLDDKVKVRIGSPFTGHGQKTRNRYARRQIANKVWKDDDGVEHVKVKFYIRGARGAGREVFSEMFKNKEDNQWKFIYLEVEIHTPYHSKMVIESYIPA